MSDGPEQDLPITDADILVARQMLESLAKAAVRYELAIEKRRPSRSDDQLDVYKDDPELDALDRQCISARKQTSALLSRAWRWACHADPDRAGSLEALAYHEMTYEKIDRALKQVILRRQLGMRPSGPLADELRAAAEVAIKPMLSDLRKAHAFITPKQYEVIESDLAEQRRWNQRTGPESGDEIGASPGDAQTAPRPVAQGSSPEADGKRERDRRTVEEIKDEALRYVRQFGWPGSRRKLQEAVQCTDYNKIKAIIESEHHLLMAESDHKVKDARPAPATRSTENPDKDVVTADEIDRLTKLDCLTPAQRAMLNSPDPEAAFLALPEDQQADLRQKASPKESR
ncbi:MAG: hypothetical protein JJU36_17955 [Phycisphaeraceae bacterium]|nr:hypothetical protein [Phycisphaeraceae bacterium]